LIIVLKFYGYKISTTAKIVTLVLHEKQILHEYIPIDLEMRQNRTPEYLTIQPFGEVPCIMSYE
jgi:glutathione S-transferase